MKNPFLKTLYHSYIVKRHPGLSFRGGWILTHLFYKDYLAHKGNWLSVMNAHRKGWSYSDWCILGINEANRRHYLSTYDYCSLHPLNGNYSSWIDDKLILKYILHGTEAGSYMPDYYFQIDDKGCILPLMDYVAEDREADIHSIVALLKERGCLAFKLMKGSLGKGFYKAAYQDGIFLLNGESMNEEKFISRISTLRGYIVTEFLKPHAVFKKYCDKSVGCLRYIIGRRLDRSLCDIYSFMRIGTSKSNYVENYNSGGVLMVVRNGSFTNGNVLDFETNRNRVVANHPDNNLALKGEIPHWDRVVEAAHTIARVLPQMVYMGIDFCVTEDDRVKVIEINSLTSLDSIQTDKSIYDTDAGEFFRERLNKRRTT